MTASLGQPLVAVICRTPLVAEALHAAFDGVAAVQALPPGVGTADLLGAVAPDAVVVDSDADADAAAVFASSSRAPVVHVAIPEGRLRVWRGAKWREDEATASPEAIRNIVIGGIYERRRME